MWTQHMILLSKSKIVVLYELISYLGARSYLYMYMYLGDICMCMCISTFKKYMYIYIYVYEVIFGITEANCGSVLRKNTFKSFNFEDPVLRHADLLMCKL